MAADSNPSGPGLSAFIDAEVRTLSELAARPDVHTAALAVETATRHLIRFVLWDSAVPEDEDATERFEVLHLSAHGLDQLLAGPPARWPEWSAEAGFRLVNLASIVAP